MATINDLLSLIDLDFSTGTIIIGDNKLENINLQEKDKITKWLYCVLHTGNLVDDVIEENNNNELVQNYFEEQDIEQRVLIKPNSKFVLDSNTVLLDGIKVLVNNNKEFYLTKLYYNLSPGFIVYKNVDLFSPYYITKRFYIGCPNFKDALKIWTEIISKLNENNIEYISKILSVESYYPRNDSIVIYCDEESENKVEKIIVDVCSNNVLKSNSFLSRKIIEGVSKADNPEDKNYSFGQHRCECISDAILDSLTTGIEFPITLENRLIQYGIDLKDVSKNGSKHENDINY